MAEQCVGLVPLQMTAVRMEEHVKQAARDVDRIAAAMVEDRVANRLRADELEREFKTQRTEVYKQAKAFRAQLIAAAVSIITTLLTVGAALLTAKGGL